MPAILQITASAKEVSLTITLSKALSSWGVEPINSKTHK